MYLILTISQLFLHFHWKISTISKNTLITPLLSLTMYTKIPKCRWYPLEFKLNSLSRGICLPIKSNLSLLNIAAELCVARSEEFILRLWVKQIGFYLHSPRESQNYKKIMIKVLMENITFIFEKTFRWIPILGINYCFNL